MYNRYVQHSLFPQLPLPSQADLVRALTPHFPELWDVIMHPWNEWLHHYRPDDRNFDDFTEDQVAWFITSLASNRARKYFDGKPGFRMIQPYGKLIIVVEDVAAITIKKLTVRENKRTRRREMTRSNYLTPTNRSYWDQQKRPDQPELPRLILGYQLLREMTDIKILLAYARTKGRGIQWAYPIPEQLPLTLPKIAIAADMEPTAGKGFAITASEPTEKTGTTGKRAE